MAIRLLTLVCTPLISHNHWSALLSFPYPNSISHVKCVFQYSLALLHLKMCFGIDSTAGATRIQKRAQELLVSDLRKVSWNVLVAPASLSESCTSSPLVTGGDSSCKRHEMCKTPSQHGPTCPCPGYGWLTFRQIPHGARPHLWDFPGTEVVWERDRNFLSLPRSCSSPLLPPTLNSTSGLTTCIFIVS